MRQRVMIALAIAANPKLLIADEPTTALDVTVQAQILELIARLRSDLNTSVILITHDLGVVAGVTDRILVMYAGKIAEEAPTDELFANPRHPYTLGLLSLRPAPRRRHHRRPARPSQARRPISCIPSRAARFSRAAPSSCPSAKPIRRYAAVGPNHRAACWVDVNDPAEQQRAAARGFIPLRQRSGLTDLRNS